IVVMIVETNLAPGDDPFALSQEIDQALLNRWREKFRVVGMYADGGKDGVMLFGQLNGAFKGAAVRIAAVYVQHARHTRIMGARDYLFAIGIVFRTVDVAMRINERHSTFIRQVVSYLPLRLLIVLGAFARSLIQVRWFSTQRRKTKPEAQRKNTNLGHNTAVKES